jgi:hypothetical protein
MQEVRPDRATRQQHRSRKRGGAWKETPDQLSGHLQLTHYCN